MAAAVMAVGAFAQGTYKYESKTTIAAGTTIEAVPNCSLTFGADGGADFSALKVATNVEGFSGYTEGNGENGKYSNGEFTGTFYELKPELDGKITVYVVLNANKNFFVYEDGVALSEYDAKVVEAKYYGPFEFNVTGGKTYDVLCTGSKLGFFGFDYVAEGEEDTTAVSTIEVAEDAPIYNMMGVRVNADAKGILIQNGKKFIRK